MIEVAVAAFVAAFIVLVAGILWGFNQRREITDRICHAQVADRKALRGSFELARRLTLSNPVRTPDERRAIRGFYTQLLNGVPPLECVHGQPQRRNER